ncbi:uncharacterized protein LOC121180917 isoform X5 [Toxotes jaculatrix]|uniref:uncharacterized protein LOC121180917 isoform X5 n=1 Tax=Toxotes jaculatrix TaxID=941984 RepID=UPI001B3ACE54|nr:uncharacterized protein LOC121180917 isoform X5 [Toxotes jaculatrix]
MHTRRETRRVFVSPGNLLTAYCSVKPDDQTPSLSVAVCLTAVMKSTVLIFAPLCWLLCWMLPVGSKMISLTSRDAKKATTILLLKFGCDSFNVPLYQLHSVTCVARNTGKHPTADSQGFRMMIY